MSGFNNGTGLVNNATIFESGYVDDLNVSNTLYYQGILLDPLLNSKVSNLINEVNDISLVVYDLSSQVLDLSVSVLDISAVVDANIIDIANNTLTITDLSNVVLDLSGRVESLEGGFDFLTASLLQVVLDVSDVSYNVNDLSSVVFDLSQTVYDLSVNGTGGDVFTGSLNVATLDATYTVLDASQADFNFGSLETRYNSLGTSGLGIIEATTASQLTLKQSQPPSTSIGGKINLQGENPVSGLLTQLQADGTEDMTKSYAPLMIMDTSGTGGRYVNPTLYFGGTATYPSTTQALYYSKSTDALRWENGYVITTNSNGEILKPTNVITGIGNKWSFKDIQIEPIATKLTRIKGLNYVDSAFTELIEFDVSGATAYLTLGDSGAVGQTVSDWVVKANRGVNIPDTGVSVATDILTNQSGNLYWGTSQLATATDFVSKSGDTMTGGLTISYNTTTDPMLKLIKTNQNSDATIDIENIYNSNKIQIGSQTYPAGYGATHKNIISASGDLIIVSNTNNSWWEFGTDLKLYGGNNAIEFGNPYTGSFTTSTIHRDNSNNLNWGHYVILNENNWSDYITGGGTGVVDNNFFYSTTAGVMDISTAFQTIDFKQASGCILTNTLNPLSLRGQGTAYTEMYLDGGNELINFNLGSSFATRNNIMQLKNPTSGATLEVSNTTANTESYIKISQSSGAHGHFGCNDTGGGRSFMYSSGASNQLYVSGGTVLTLLKSTYNNLAFSPNHWASGSIHYFGLSSAGDTTGNATSGGRYFSFNYDRGIQYNTYGYHDFNILPSAGTIVSINSTGLGFQNQKYMYYAGNTHTAIQFNTNMSCNATTDNSYYQNIWHPLYGSNMYWDKPTAGVFYWRNWNYNTPATLNGNGDFTAGTLNTFSSRKIKQDIQELADDECLTMVEKIEPVSYNYKDPERREKQNGKRVIGFIAENVNDVNPLLTNTEDCNIPNILTEYDISINVIITDKRLDNVEVGTKLYLQGLDQTVTGQIKVEDASGAQDASAQEIVETSSQDAEIAHPEVLEIKPITISRYTKKYHYVLNKSYGKMTRVFVYGTYEPTLEIVLNRFTPVLWSATQQLIRKNKAQALKIQELEQKQISLEERLAKLEQTFIA